MRTTVTLDADAQAIIQKLMRERGLTFKQAVNQAIKESGRSSERRKPFRTRTYDMGVANVPGHKFLQLAGELEDQEIIRKMRLGK